MNGNIKPNGLTNGYFDLQSHERESKECINKSKGRDSDRCKSPYKDKYCEMSKNWEKVNHSSHKSSHKDKDKDCEQQKERSGQDTDKRRERSHGEDRSKKHKFKEKSKDEPKSRDKNKKNVTYKNGKSFLKDKQTKQKRKKSSKRVFQTDWVDDPIFSFDKLIRVGLKKPEKRKIINEKPIKNGLVDSKEDKLVLHESAEVTQEENEVPLASGKNMKIKKKEGDKVKPLNKRIKMKDEGNLKPNNKNKYHEVSKRREKGHSSHKSSNKDKERDCEEHKERGDKDAEKSRERSHGEDRSKKHKFKERSKDKHRTRSEDKKNGSDKIDRNSSSHKSSHKDKHTEYSRRNSPKKEPKFEVNDPIFSFEGLISKALKESKKGEMLNKESVKDKPVDSEEDQLLIDECIKLSPPKNKASGENMDGKKKELKIKIKNEENFKNDESQKVSSKVPSSPQTRNKESLFCRINGNLLIVQKHIILANPPADKRYLITTKPIDECPECYTKLDISNFVFDLSNGIGDTSCVECALPIYFVLSK